VALALQLLVALVQMATADSPPRNPFVTAPPSGSKGSFAESFAEFVTVVWVVAQVGATATALIGSVFCTLSPAAPSIRAAAGAVLALAGVGAVLSANPFG